MRKNIPTVRDGLLIEDPEAGSDRAPIAVGSEAWFSWLEGAQRFAFDDPKGHFTARKRQRAGIGYWYAFKRLGGRYQEPYLGKSHNIQLDTLRRVADMLTGGHPPPPLPPAPTDGPHPPDGPGLGLLPTNLAVPHINPAQLVPVRAMHRLGSALERPLTLVSAPPGYGKTTLLAQWVLTSRVSAAWLSLDASDIDPVMLYEYVCAALDQVVPGLFEKMRPLLYVNHSQVPSAVLTKLIQELSGAPDPTVLVLDDYDHIPRENALVHEMVSFLVEHLPPQVHLVIASRTDPPLPLARLRTRGHLLELRAKDLAFTQEESAVFLTDRMGLDASTEQVAALHERTEGWVGALQLAALSLAERPDAASSLTDALGESRHMVEYLIEEVMQRLTSDMRSFLLRVALLDRLTAPLCEAVTGATNGQAMLTAMERANLFLVPLDDQPQWYRFHGLFATAVRHYVRESQPEIVPQVYVRASAWCEANGHIGEAISYAFAADDLGHAAVLLESFAEVALDMGYITMLREMLSRLPDDIVRERPRLCVAHAYVLFMSGERVVYPRRVQDAEDAFAKSAHLLAPSDRAVLEGEIVALRASVAHASRHTRPGASAAMFGQALALLPDPHPFRNFASAYLGLNYMLDGDVRAASQTLASLLRRSEASGDVLYVAASALYLGLTMLFQRRLDEALALYRRVAHHFEGSHHAGLEGALHLVMGTVLYERNDLESAFDHLGRSLAVCFDLTMPLYAGYPMLASVHHAQGNDAEARRTMERSLARWEHLQAAHAHAYQWAGRLIHAQQARLWLIWGELPAAAGWARQRESWIADDRTAEIEPPTFVRELEDIVLARAHLAEGRPDEALALLKPLARAAEASGRIYRLIEMLVLQASAYDALNNTSLALLTLGRALELAAPERCTRMFIDGGPTILRLMVQLVSTEARQPEQRQREISPDYLAELAMAMGLTGQAISGARWPVSPGAGAQLSMGRGERPPHTERLTPRETQVLALIEMGLSNKEIAHQLFPMKLTTVKHHVQNIFMKLDAHSRTQAVARARALQLLPSEPGNPGGNGNGGVAPSAGQGHFQEPGSEISPGYTLMLDHPVEDTDSPA